VSPILCHFEPELRPELIDALRRYVFATQVELTDVTLPAGRTFPLTAATLQHGLDLLGIAAPDRL